MASLRKIPGSKVWFACFRDAKGNAHQKTTKTKDVGAPAERAEARRNAQAIAEHFESVARGALATQVDVFQATNRLLRKVGRQELAVPTVQVYLTSWLARQKADVAPATYVKYEKPIRDFKAHVGAALLMADVTVQHVSDFKDAQLERGLSRSTANVLLKIMRMPFHEALAAGVISVNPTVLVHVKRIFPHQRNCFTVDQVRALLQAADDEMKIAIYLGLFTGLRLGDVIGLQRSDLSEDLSYLCLSPEKRRDGARAPLVVPFHSELKAHLASCCGGLQPGDFLMPKLHAIDIGGRNGVSRRFHELIERAGISNPAVKEKSREGRSFYALSYHSLRHTFNSWLANAGVRKETRMKLLDHRSERVNDGYTHVQLEALKEAVEQLPQLAG